MKRKIIGLFWNRPHRAFTRGFLAVGAVAYASIVGNVFNAAVRNEYTWWLNFLALAVAVCGSFAAVALADAAIRYQRYLDRVAEVRVARIRRNNRGV